MFSNLDKNTKQIINRQQISLNPNKFIEDPTKIDSKNIFQIKAIILKVLAKVIPPEAVFEEAEKIVKLEYDG
jgi:hypothetical protein